MKKFLLTITMLLTLGLSIQGVAAQGVDAPVIEGVDLSEIEGLESAYSRTYSVDIVAMMSSPDADVASMDTSAMLRSISIQAYTFEDEDNAKDYVNDMKDQADDSMSDMEDIGEIEIKDLEAVDKDGFTMTMVMDMDDMSIAVTMHVFVDGNTVFMVTSTDSDLETTSPGADAVAQYIVDNEAGSDEVTFVEDGTSTGGVFDRMPKAGDELVADLVATDMEVYVAA